MGPSVAAYEWLTDSQCFWHKLKKCEEVVKISAAARCTSWNPTSLTPKYAACSIRHSDVLRNCIGGHLCVITQDKFSLHCICNTNSFSGNCLLTLSWSFSVVFPVKGFFFFFFWVHVYGCKDAPQSDLLSLAHSCDTFQWQGFVWSWNDNLINCLDPQQEMNHTLKRLLWCFAFEQKMPNNHKYANVSFDFFLKQFQHVTFGSRKLWWTFSTFLMFH